jgi:hypothetical protein
MLDDSFLHRALQWAAIWSKLRQVKHEIQLLQEDLGPFEATQIGHETGDTEDSFSLLGSSSKSPLSLGCLFEF